jgi:phosphoglycerate dehydrogenase-like enzyme
MKPTALLINIGRAAIVDEEALYAALRDRPTRRRRARCLVAALEPDHPDRSGSRFPFHELPTVLMTPHCSGFTEGTADRRWGDLAANLDRYMRGEERCTISCSESRDPFFRFRPEEVPAFAGTRWPT